MDYRELLIYCMYGMAWLVAHFECNYRYIDDETALQIQWHNDYPSAAVKIALCSRLLFKEKLMVHS